MVIRFSGEQGRFPSVRRGDENPTLKWKKDTESGILTAFELSHPVTLGGHPPVAGVFGEGSISDTVLDQSLSSLSLP